MTPLWLCIEFWFCFLIIDSWLVCKMIKESRLESYKLKVKRLAWEKYFLKIETAAWLNK